MKLKEILDHLTFNELSQHKLGGFKEGHVADENIPKLLTTINEGIRSINRRIEILQGITVVRLSANKQYYTMSKEFAEVAGVGSTETKYIIDTVTTPFKGKFRKFVQIVDSGGNTLLVNVRELSSSLALPNYNTFQHPSPIEGDFVSVEYLYDPDDLVSTTMVQASTEEYPLPYFTAPALYAYVAMSLNIGMSTQQSNQENMMNTNKYENEIKLLEDNTILVGDTCLVTRFTNNGWI